MKQRYKEFEVRSSPDDRSYVVNKIGEVQSGDNKGSETLSLVGYFNELEPTIARIAKLCGNWAEDLKGWLEEYRQVHEDFQNLLSVD